LKNIISLERELEENLLKKELNYWRESNNGKRFPKKNKLGKHGRQTKWAPFWIIPKALEKVKECILQKLLMLKDTGEELNLKLNQE
jgi:ribosomal protein L39E